MSSFSPSSMYSLAADAENILLLPTRVLSTLGWNEKSASSAMTVASVSGVALQKSGSPSTLLASFMGVGVLCILSSVLKTALVLSTLGWNEKSASSAMTAASTSGAALRKSGSTTTSLTSFMGVGALCILSSALKKAVLLPTDFRFIFNFSICGVTSSSSSSSPAVIVKFSRGSLFSWGSFEFERMS